MFVQYYKIVNIFLDWLNMSHFLGNSTLSSRLGHWSQSEWVVVGKH